MNWEYFSTSPRSVCGSRNSIASSFNTRLTVVPRSRVGPRGSGAMVNSVASLSQMYCSSLLCLDVTITVSATEGEEGRREGEEKKCHITNC